jgi:hypothetical protein
VVDYLDSLQANPVKYASLSDPPVSCIPSLLSLQDVHVKNQKYHATIKLFKITGLLYLLSPL